MSDPENLSLDELIDELTHQVSSKPEVLLSSKSAKALIAELKRLYAASQVSSAQQRTTERSRDGGVYRFAGTVLGCDETTECCEIQWDGPEAPKEGTLLYFRLYTQEELDEADLEAEQMCSYFKTKRDPKA